MGKFKNAKIKNNITVALTSKGKGLVYTVHCTGSRNMSKPECID